MMSTQSKEIKAVHVADLEDLLRKYGQLQDFNDGKMMCYTCNDKISVENAGSIKRANGKFLFTCNKISCYNQIVKNMQ